MCFWNQYCLMFSFNYKTAGTRQVIIYINISGGDEDEPQLFQSWKRKQSLAIFQTGCSLLGDAWAVKRKFWLKKRCLFPSNLTIPAVATSSVVWPWVACSVNEERDIDAGLTCLRTKKIIYIIKHSWVFTAFIYPMKFDWVFTVGITRYCPAHTLLLVISFQSSTIGVIHCTNTSLWIDNLYQFAKRIKYWVIGTI